MSDEMFDKAASIFDRVEARLSRMVPNCIREDAGDFKTGDRITYDGKPGKVVGIWNVKGEQWADIEVRHGNATTSANTSAKMVPVSKLRR